MLENAKQKFVVRHYSENDFKGGGLRGEAEYRDLGVAEATNGRFTAHVARIAPGAVKEDLEATLSRRGFPHGLRAQRLD